MAIDHDEDEDDVDEAQPMPHATLRAFSAIRGYISKYDIPDACRGCKSIGLGWQRPMAHPEECRHSIIEEMLKDGGGY